MLRDYTQNICYMSMFFRILTCSHKFENIFLTQLNKYVYK